MKRRRFNGLLIVASLLLLALLFVSWRQSPQQVAARQHLNNLLGQADASEPPAESRPFTAPALPDLGMNPFSALPMPKTDVAVEETSSQYVLRVPLASPEDSGAVKLNVTPHRIEISGQSGGKENGSSFSASFMQAFTTSQEVLPDQVHRLTEKNGDKTELVITIPKKQGGTASSKGDLPDLDEDQAQPIQTPVVPPANPSQEGNPNPLDTFSNKVI